MNYEKLYKEAFELARDYHEDKNCFEYLKGVLENIFPELKESEDERVRKAQLDYWRSVGGKEWHGVPVQEVIAWLEKQGGNYVDCPKNHQDMNHPNGGIVMEDFNGGEGFYKLNLDYLNKKQVEEIEEKVKTWNTKPNDDIIKECVGMALTDVPQSRFESYGTSLKECLAWLEKQGQVKDSNISQHENKMCKENDDSLTYEDEMVRQAIIDTLNGYHHFGSTNGVLKEKMIAWLEKANQKSKWTEEDEKNILLIVDYLNQLFYSDNRFNLKELNDLRNWLESLKQRMEE